MKMVECMKYNHHCCPKVGNIDRHLVSVFITVLIVFIILLAGALVGIIIWRFRKMKKVDDMSLLGNQDDYGFSTADTWRAGNDKLLDFDYGGTGKGDTMGM